MRLFVLSMPDRLYRLQSNSIKRHRVLAVHLTGLKKLNVTLLERTTRKIKLTQEGSLFLVRARTILADLSDAEEALLKSDSDTSGQLRVDSATPFVLHVIAPLMKKFMQRYPNIEIELNNNDQVIDLLEHKTDVAIRFGALHDSSLHARLICKSRLYIVASPEYLAEHGHPRHSHELNTHQTIGFSRPVYLNTWPLKVGEEYYRIEPKITASSGETVRQSALSGHGIARLSEFEIWQDLQAGRLVALFEDQIERRFSIFMRCTISKSTCQTASAYSSTFWPMS